MYCIIQSMSFRIRNKNIHRAHKIKLIFIISNFSAFVILEYEKDYISYDIYDTLLEL